MHASFITSIIACALVCGWSAFLINQGIANFNDGVRPLIREWLQGNLERKEVARVSRDLGREFILRDAPFSLISAIVMAWPILIVADIIGSAIAPPAFAVVVGCMWGGVVAGATQGIYHGLEALPINIIAAFGSVISTFLWGFSAIPVVACAYQFGARIGAVAGVLAGGVWLLLYETTHVDTGGLTPASLGSSAAILTGLGVLIVWAIRTDLWSSGEPESSIFQFEPLPSRTSQIRAHLPLLLVQGALLGFAARSFAMSWTQLDLAGITSHHQVEAGIIALPLAFGFWPTIVTSAVTTGVYQTVGIATVFVVSYFAPNPWLGAAFGAIATAIEILSLDRINTWFERFHTLRASTDALRAAYGLIIPVAILAGSIVVAGEMLPGGLGYAVIIGGLVLNQHLGGKLSASTAPILLAVIVGIVANVLTIFGLMPVPHVA